ncbi:MAG TPA: histidine phosphatase family protein [Casimicrobiaceae bacterium]|nr:histidine phosphatase family protein [Casimicrobiaceae bacterium]
MGLRSSRRRIARLLGVFAIAAAGICIAPAALGQSTESVREAAPPLAGASLLNALQRGGYVIYFRHTSTDFGQNDDRMTGYEDCERQRNLTDAGRNEARAIGAAIRALGIPIGAVLASPFCRTRETAELIFGRATVSNAVRGGPAQADDNRYAELKKLLSTPVTGAVDLVIVSHGNPYRAIVGGPYLAEGEAAVIEPRGNDGFRVVAHVRKDEWPALSAAK